ncbi:HlyD family type I secretion periplasmic adaptor subunit [Methylobacterium sp. WL116]|uniref:HlyD family type I secretion periplasmic adaptor subunit n=1 Tax=Methylobacterium sp. WL116 TaxID=2603889 RepID=UPI0011CC53BC|nr:HlyD family type I secretion periplasmic adaptor subunit [Methylobacterium sp. WL116]TXM94260.1 HlyD family type I secretion periplasmic adaptor subunit [Methylobacterium sp. WL116]
MSTKPDSAPPALPSTTLPVPARPRALSAKVLRERVRAIASSREDQEFLPAHLEILDTPPSPLAMVFTWTLCLMFGCALLWSTLASLDIHAIASARIQPSGRSKVIQPFETSRVQVIHVHNGDTVKAGMPLIELDATEAKAELTATEDTLASYEAQIARRRASITAIKENLRTIEPEFPATVSASIRTRENAAMTAELSQYFATRAALSAQTAEKEATRQRFTASAAARERLKAVLSERATMRETLVARSSGTRAAVIDALQQVEQVAADLAYDQGQIVEAQAAEKSLERRIEQLTDETLAKQAQALTEASQKADTARQDAVRARVRWSRTQLRAPIDGTVQQLAVTTIGQVVTAGQPLLVVVPSSGPIEIEALVLNQDIGFVLLGQDAVVKIDSFPFTRYGTVEGKVIRISRDAIDDRDASGSTDVLSLTRGQNIGAVTGTPRTQNLVFPVTIEVEKNNIVADGKPVVLSPGMTATVEIRTGNRRVIDYVLSPITETTSTAGHER